MAEANPAKKLAPNSEMGASFLGTPAKPHLPVFAVLLSRPRLFWHLGELRDLRMVSSSMTELVGGLRLSGLLGSTKCPKCDACGSASAIILHRRLKHGMLPREWWAPRGARDPFKLTERRGAAGEDGLLYATPDAVDPPEELEQLMASASLCSHDASLPNEMASEESDDSDFGCAEMIMDCTGYLCLRLLEFPGANANELISVAIDVYDIGMPGCFIGGFHMSWQVASNKPFRLVERGFGERRGWIGTHAHEECSADADALLAALGLTQTSASQLVATLISSVLDEGACENLASESRDADEDAAIIDPALQLLA